MIYFVAGGDLVKIGTAEDVPARVMKLQIGSPISLRLLGCVPGDRDVEQLLHHRFRDLHVRGEWFRYVDELRAYVESGFEGPYAALSGDMPCFGLIGDGFERSLYRAYAKVKAGWWRFEWQGRPVKYDPIVKYARVSVRTTQCCLRDLREYEWDQTRPALQRLLSGHLEKVRSTQ